MTRRISIQRNRFAGFAQMPDGKIPRFAE